MRTDPIPPVTIFDTRIYLAMMLCTRPRTAKTTTMVLFMTKLIAAGAMILVMAGSGVRDHFHNKKLQREYEQVEADEKTGKTARGEAPPRRSCICSNCRRVMPTNGFCQRRKGCKSKNAAAKPCVAAFVGPTHKGSMSRTATRTIAGTVVEVVARTVLVLVLSRRSG